MYSLFSIYFEAPLGHGEQLCGIGEQMCGLGSTCVVGGAVEWSGEQLRGLGQQLCGLGGERT